MTAHTPSDNPLRRLDDWEDFVETRYPTPAAKAREDYRNYDDPARATVREFYRLNHRYQTYAFVQQKKRDFLQFNRRQMTVLEALDFLDTLVDDSDPDIELSQREHLLQTAEAIRADGHDDWFVLTGLIHDLGKVLCLFGEPQWAVVGDTFPVGCAFSERIVYPEFFADNPDRADPKLQSACGVYAARLRPAERPSVLGTRRVFVPRGEGPLAGAGAVHDPLPFVLRLASRGGVRASARRARPPDAAVGPAIQSV